MPYVRTVDLPWPWPDRTLVEAPAGTDVWALHTAGAWVLIPTNTQRKSDGTAVMGAGLALAAAQRFPGVPIRYGRALAAGHTRITIPDHRLLLAPTKIQWRRPARMSPVTELLTGVARWSTAHPDEVIAVPSPGCGHGGLPWAQVQAAALEHLADHPVILLPPLG